MDGVSTGPGLRRARPSGPLAKGPEAAGACDRGRGVSRRVVCLGHCLFQVFFLTAQLLTHGEPQAFWMLLLSGKS